MLSRLFGLLAPSLLAASFASPLDWSADGRWLAYTIVKDDAPTPPDDWFFPRGSEADAGGEAEALARRATFQAWATRPDGTDPVLIEESRRPLSPPVWGPGGESLYYARFVAEKEGGAATASTVRGRYEVVARTGLDPSRGRAIPLRHELELDAERIAAIVAAGPAISADGRFAAVPKPEKSGGLWVVRLDQDRVVRDFESARHPAWSPDGRRLSFMIDDSGAEGGAPRSVAVWNRDRGAERRINLDVALMDVPPVWSLDGQSLLAVAAPTGGLGRPAQVDLVQINLETGFGVRVMTLETIAPVNRPRSTVLGRPLIPPNTPEPPAAFRLELGLDRERDQALCLVDAGEGQQAFTWCNTRTRTMFKRFHPLDPTIRVGSPALSPDGQSVAFRVEGRDGLGLPAVCELATESVTLLAPDADARDRWLTELAFRSIGLIEQGVKIHEGEPPETWATVLPFPDEFATDAPRQFRLARLSKIAAGLIQREPKSGATGDWGSKSIDEFALFFSYLRGDYRAAESRLDRVEARDQAPESQLRRLLLRAQILMGQGEMDRARGIADYLDRATASERRVVEETPLGPVASSVVGPERAWSRRLSRKLAAPGDSLSEPTSEPEPEAEINGGGGATPAPLIPAADAIIDDPFAAPLAPGIRARRVPPTIRLEIAPAPRIVPPAE